MKKHFPILILFFLFFPSVQGKVKLPAMMGDRMVLQQNSSVKLWGWADGKKVTVTTSWDNRTYEAPTGQGRSVATESRHSRRRLYALYDYHQRRDSGHSLGYSDRRGVDMFRPVEYGDAHDGKYRAAGLTTHLKLFWTQATIATASVSLLSPKQRIRNVARTSKGENGKHLHPKPQLIAVLLLISLPNN